MRKNWIIILLMIIILGLGGYLVYDKVLSSDNSKVENSEVKEENYDLVIAKELIDKYYYSYETLSGTAFETGYTEDAMMYLAVENVRKSDITTASCDKLYGKIYKDNGMGQYTVSLDNGNAGFCTIHGNSEEISYDALDKSYKELFGKNKILAKSDFNFGGMIYDYNDEMDSFVSLSCNCGGGPGGIEFYGIQSAKKINDKLIINVGRVELKAGKIGENSYTLDFYTVELDGQSLKYNYEEIYDSNYSTKAFEQQFLNQYLNKLDTYTFTFFEEDEIYKLESMVKV